MNGGRKPHFTKGRPSIWSANASIDRPHLAQHGPMRFANGRPGEERSLQA